MSLTVRIYGPPVPQGSMKSFVVKGRPIITSNNAAKLKPWRQGIAETFVAEGAKPMDGPCFIVCRFYVRRPPSRAKRYKEPDKRPDLDKLLRSVLDALTGIAYHDDGQIVGATIRKHYATASEPEGVWIHVGTDD